MNSDPQSDATFESRWPSPARGLTGRGSRAKAAPPWRASRTARASKGDHRIDCTSRARVASKVNSQMGCGHWLPATKSCRATPAITTPHAGLGERPDGTRADKPHALRPAIYRPNMRERDRPKQAALGEMGDVGAHGVPGPTLERHRQNSARSAQIGPVSDEFAPM